MTIYEKNLKTLAKYYPEMDVLIENTRKKMEPELEVLVEDSYDGEKILKIRKDERNLYLNGRRNAKEVAKLWVEQQGYLVPNATVYMWGVGNYLYLRELVEKTENRITIFVCEPSLQIFVKFLEIVDIESWMEKHLIVFWVYGIEGMNEKTLEKMLNKLISYETMAYSRNLVLPNYEYLFPDETINFVKKCKEIAQQRSINHNTNLRFSTVAGKNILSNIRYLPDAYKTVQLVQVIPRDIPGIVVAAGPSLNKNIQELKNAKGKAFIIAVDTAIKPLLKAGIVPDMFAIVDGLKPLFLIEEEEAKKIPLVTTMMAASEVLNYHTGMKFFFNEGHVFAEKIFNKSKERFGPMTSGGSVATMAFNLLYRIGLTRIILVGQDLAFTGNKSHADGTFREKMQEEDTKNYIMVEGNVEEKVPTRGDFKNYLDWYDNFITNAKEINPDFCVINATEGGAKIKGTEVMTLKDAIEQECTKDVDIQACLGKLNPMLDDDGRKWAINYLSNIQQEFEKVETEAKTLQKLYHKLDKICDRKNIDKNEYLSILKKIERSIKQIEGNDTYQIIRESMVQANSILLNEAHMQEKTVKEEGKEIARKGIIFASCVQECASVFAEYEANL